MYKRKVEGTTNSRALHTAGPSRGEMQADSDVCVRVCVCSSRCVRMQACMLVLKGACKSNLMRPAGKGCRKEFISSLGNSRRPARGSQSACALILVSFAHNRYE